MYPILALGIITGLGYLLIHSIFGDEAKAASSPTPDDLAPLRRQALGLLKYINAGGRDRARISAYQRTLGVPTSGIPDAASESRIEELLGYDVSWKPMGKKVTARTFGPAKGVVPTGREEITRTPAKLTPAVPAEKATATGPLAEIIKSLEQPPRPPALKPPKKASVRAAPASSSPRALPAQTQTQSEADNVSAARELDSYLRNGGLEKPRIKQLQARMGFIAADGIAGNETRQRAEALLGAKVNWPAIMAAEDLHIYYTKGGRAKRDISDFQKLMGVTADGLIGPVTKARYKAMTGKVW